MVGIRKIVALSPSSVFVLLGGLASLPPPASHALDPLAPYCYALFSWHLICPLGWHPSAPHNSWHLHCSVALLAGWLPSSSSPAPRFTLPSQLVMVTVFHGIALPPWMFLKSVAMPITGQSARVTPCPLAYVGWGISVLAPGNSSFSPPLRRDLVPKILSFVLGSLLKGFFAPVRFYVGFLLGYSILCFPPH